MSDSFANIIYHRLFRVELALTEGTDVPISFYVVRLGCFHENYSTERLIWNQSPNNIPGASRYIFPATGKNCLAIFILKLNVVHTERKENTEN
jgi:hypothetical protein